MLLTCPACSARYDVPATALPAEGRIVRCSNCRAEWLARPSAAAPAPAGEPAAPAPAEPLRTERAEASQPSEPRAAEAESAALPGAERAATVREPGPGHAEPDLPEPDLQLGDDDEPRVEALAPIRDADPARALLRTLDEEPERRGGFVAGFATVTIVVLLAVVTYVKHAEIASAVPAVARPLEAYAGAVDAGRVELERLVSRLRGLTG